MSRAEIIDGAEAPRVREGAGPCRPYWPGDHARALRGKIVRGLVLGALLAFVGEPLLRAAAFTVLTGFEIENVATPPLVELIDMFGFGALGLLGFWAFVGPRRWAAIEILVWGSRYAVAGYAAVTGIRDPTDGAAAAAWLQAQPFVEGEPAEVTYWRAHAQFVSRDLDGARTSLARVAGRGEYEVAVASLRAQMALAEAREPDLAAVERGVTATKDSLERAVGAASLGALRAQYAWTCGRDDVAAALSVRGMMGRHSFAFLLTRLWLPLVLLTVGVTIIGSGVQLPFSVR